MSRSARCNSRERRHQLERLPDASFSSAQGESRYCALFDFVVDTLLRGA
jgi:hypothetical protein